MPQKDSADKAVRDIRRKTRRKFSAKAGNAPALSAYSLSFARFSR